VADLAALKPFSLPQAPARVSTAAPKFSIIVPTRNRPGPLRIALGAIARQTYSDFEVIVLDDGSDAECRAQYADLWDSLDDRFSLKLVSPDGSPGIGPSLARNLAISQARGELVAFCDDDDDWCAADHLAVAAEAFSEVPDADIFYANQIAFRDDKVINTERWPKLRRWLHKAPRVGSYDVCRLPRRAFLRSGGVAHLNISIVRRSLVNEINGFWNHLRFEEDFDFYLRSIDRARAILYRPSIVARHLAPMPKNRGNASTALDVTERCLAQCMACEHIRVKVQSREVMMLARATQGYALRRLALALHQSSQHTAAFTAGIQAMAILPSLRWSVFMLYLGLRQVFAPSVQPAPPYTR